VWSWTKNDLRSDLFIHFISKRSFNNFLGDFDNELKPVELWPIKTYKGGNLSQYLSNNQYHYLRNRLDQLADIVNGLKTIHVEGLVHRDLHPGNN